MQDTDMAPVVLDPEPDPAPPLESTPLESTPLESKLQRQYRENPFHTLPNEGAFEEPDPDDPLILSSANYFSIGAKSLMPPQLEPSTMGLSIGDANDLYNELRNVIATIFIQKLTPPSKVAAAAAAAKAAADAAADAAAAAAKAAADAAADAGDAAKAAAAEAAAAKAAAAEAATNPLVVLQGMKPGELLHRPERKMRQSKEISHYIFFILKNI